MQLRVVGNSTLLRWRTQRDGDAVGEGRNSGEVDGGLVWVQAFRERCPLRWLAQPTHGLSPDRVLELLGRNEGFFFLPPQFLLPKEHLHAVLIAQALIGDTTG